MRAAFAIWGGRIAPVFDVTRHVRLVDVDGGRIVRAETGEVPAASAVEKAKWLVDRGIGLLVCGAISRPLQGMIAAHGIMVIPFIAGELREIERAWLAGTLEEGPFAMPGCWRAGGRFRGRRGICVCPACGYREPHERGVPCSGKRCPKCGAALMRA